MAVKYSSPGTHNVPILVGVIGHRDLIPEEIEDAENKLKIALQTLTDRYKESPIYVVTSLAEGADFLGAKVAMQLGIPLVSLLPMPVDEYKTHFKEAANATMLEKYVEQSIISHVCEPVTGQEGTDDDRFARSGAAVMQYSHIVIALWDGVWTGYESGTSFLVKHAIEGIPQRIKYELEGDFVSPLDPISTATVRQIPMARLSNRKIVKPNFPVQPEPGKFCEIEFNKKVTKAKLNLGHTQERVFQHFDDFNRDMKRYQPRSGTWSEAASYPPLVPEESASNLTAGLKVLRERYAMADQLALHFQKRRHQFVLKYVIFLAAFIAFFHQIITSRVEIHEWLKLSEFWTDKLSFGNLFNLSTSWPYIFYGLLIVMGSAFVAAIRKRRWQQRYLDYRTIAEGSRTQFFWLIGGIRCPAVNYFLRKQMDELEWIRGVMRLWYLRAITEGGWLPDASVEQATLIETYWIRDQLDYSRKKSAEYEKLDRNLKLISTLLLILLFATIMVKAINLSVEPFYTFKIGEVVFIKVNWDLVLTMLGALAGSGAILISSFRYFFNINNLPRTHNQMAVLFSDADKAYDPSDGIQEDERDILKELGRESLAEVGDWLLTNRKRKLKLPTAPIKHD